MFDWKKAVSTVAPTLGRALGGPVGGMAVSMLTKALGIPDNAPESRIEDAIKNDPEAIAKIRQIESEFELKMKELGITEKQLVFDDIKSARERQIKTKDYTPPILSGLITFGFFGLLYLLIFHPIPEGAKDVLQIMIGSLGAAWLAVVTYYFGSSHGSSKKNDLIKGAN